MNADFRMAELPWKQDAACRGLDPAIWFPKDGERNEVAKAICAGCPVRVACLDFAVDQPERYGVWGGLSEDERRPITRARYGSKTGPRPAPAKAPKRKAS